MTKLKALMSATISILALASTGPAYAQSSNFMTPEANPVALWTLSKTYEKLNRPLQITTYPHAKSSPWVKDSASAISRIDTPQYTPVSMSDFAYTLAGPFKLSVGKRYQRQVSTNLPQMGDYLVTKPSDSNPYQMVIYETASSATIGFDVGF